MTRDELEHEVSRALHELFPEPPDVALRTPPSRSRHHTPQALAILGSAAAVAIIAGLRLVPDAFSAASAAPAARPAAGAARSATATPAPAASTPAWALACLPQDARYRLGPAADYLGLTRQAASQLAREHGSHLFIVGAGGHCGIPEPQVAPALANLVAIVLDRGDSVHGPLPAGARVIAAERVSSQWPGPRPGQ